MVIKICTYTLLLLIVSSYSLRIKDDLKKIGSYKKLHADSSFFLLNSATIVSNNIFHLKTEIEIKCDLFN